MSRTDHRVAIISFDGLSGEQFETLLPQMPAIHSLTTNGRLTEFDSTPFSDAQPIWAEILTGQPWYRNGCAGYATPVRSINELKMFAESDLQFQTFLLPTVREGQCNIVINIPLLEARNQERKWLSDANSPTLVTVSPSALLNSEPFKNYKPRPIISMGEAMADFSATSSFINTEVNRAECASALVKDVDWKLFMYRVSIFDQISHLLGPTFLDESRLKVSAPLKRLLATLDAVLYEVVSRADDYLFLSAFSHVACKEMFSLNDFFQGKRLLERTGEMSEEDIRRKQAFTLINSHATTPLVSDGNHVSPAHTICASPIRGAVYVNSTARFADGIVGTKDLKQSEAQISQLLSEELRKFSGRTDLVHNSETDSGAPNFIVNIQGVDLVDNLQTVRRSYNIPHSVHDSRGFIWSRATNSKPVKSVGIVELMSELK